MGYWTYYLAFLVLAYLLQYPWLLGGVVVLFVLRRFVPDPFVLLRTMGRIRGLRAQVESNLANITARRDLARIYLERLRPRAALKLLDEARKREPSNPELLYLTGLARHRIGDHESALGPLVEAVQGDGRLRFGEPYMIAGDSLTQLGRDEEAEDAYERYVDSNSSSIEGHLKLARTRRRRGNRDGAKRALQEALDTFGQLPSFRRRQQLGWWLRAQVARLYT